MSEHKESASAEPQKRTTSADVRLNVFLQEHGVASRRKADALIEDGAVSVNGFIVRTLGTKVKKTDAVCVHNKLLNRKPAKSIYIFHKPYLTLTSRSDDRERPTIYDLPELSRLPGNVQPVGRLDFKSEGLLILTNDGDLSLALSHPKYAVEKTYTVLLSKSITTQELESLRRGVQLEDGMARPLSAKIKGRESLGSSTGQWVELIVNEGRNRLVRRMMEALGLHVVRLVRVAIGHLRLPTNLGAGKKRLATPDEKKYLNDLKKAALNTAGGSRTTKDTRPAKAPVHMPAEDRPARPARAATGSRPTKVSSRTTKDTRPAQAPRQAKDERPTRPARATTGARPTKASSRTTRDTRPASRDAKKRGPRGIAVSK